MVSSAPPKTARWPCCPYAGPMKPGCSRPHTGPAAHPHMASAIAPERWIAATAHLRRALKLQTVTLWHHNWAAARATPAWTAMKNHFYARHADAQEGQKAWHKTVRARYPRITSAADSKQYAALRILRTAAESRGVLTQYECEMMAVVHATRRGIMAADEKMPTRRDDRRRHTVAAMRYVASTGGSDLHLRHIMLRHIKDHDLEWMRYYHPERKF